MYRVALTYHPDVGTFRGKRGAWRVWGAWLNVECDTSVSTSVTRTDHSVLVLPTCREHRKGTWVNPLKILKDYQSTKRSST